MLYWNKIFKVFIPIICWIYGNCLVNIRLLTRQGKSFKGKFFSLCCSYQAKISQVVRSFFVMLLLSSQDFTGHQEIFYMWEISFALEFTSLHVSLSIYRSILRSCDRKFVFRFWAHRQRVAVVDVIVTGKRELPQVKSQVFVCGGLGNLPPKIFAQRKFPGKLSLYQ